jgi:hypothetical protein
VENQQMGEEGGDVVFIHAAFEFCKQEMVCCLKDTDC